MSWLNLHRIASVRGDGLDPRLLALLEKRSAPSTVVDLADHRAGGRVQAGPSPLPVGPVAVAGNIVLLSARSTTVAEPQKRITRTST